MDKRDIEKIQGLTERFNRRAAELVSVDEVLALVADRTNADGDIELTIADKTVLFVPAQLLTDHLANRKQNIENALDTLAAKFVIQ